MVRCDQAYIYFYFSIALYLGHLQTRFSLKKSIFFSRSKILIENSKNLILKIFKDHKNLCMTDLITMLVLPTNPSPTKTKRMMLSVELVLLVMRVLLSPFSTLMISSSLRFFLLTLEFLKIWNFGKFFWGHSIPFRRWILHFIFSFSFSSAFCSLSEYYDVPNYDEYRFIGTF